MNAHRSCVVTVLRTAALRALFISGLVACSATHGSAADDDAETPPTMSDGSSQAGASSGGSGTGGRSSAPSGTAGMSAGTDAGTGAGGAAGMAGAAGTTGTTVTPDMPDAQLIALATKCGFIDTSMLHGLCPEAAMTGHAACSRDELFHSCSYIQFALDDADERAPLFVCQSQCVALEGSPFWSGWCTECASACADPGPGEVHELDISDCKARPLTPCADGLETKQVSLDATLTALLPASSGVLSELRNTSLQIELQDGCVSRFFAPNSADPLTRLSALLGPAVADKRFACAEALSCARVQGPDTQATL